MLLFTHMNTDLSLFVRESLAKGVSRKEISSSLQKAGWQPDEVRDALAAYAEVDSVVPVPRRRPYLSAHDAFLYLIMFFTLYVSAFSFGSIWFEFIKRTFPDPLVIAGGVGNLDTIRSSLAAIIIAFPLFFWISWLLKKAIAKNPEKRGSKIRKWLTYLTLFIAATIIIGDLITLMYNLLSGALTTPLSLKILTVGVIAGVIFGYYLWDLWADEKES